MHNFFLEQRPQGQPELARPCSNTPFALMTP